MKSINLDISLGEIFSRLDSFPQSVSLLVYREGNVQEKSNGKADINLPVELGCVTKALTATLFGVLLGKQYLEKSVFQYFSDCIDNEKTADHFRKLKVYHLLNQTCGIDNSLFADASLVKDGIIDKDELFRVINKSEILSSPGSMQVVTSIGSYLVAIILEQVVGAQFNRLLHEYILAPLAIGDRSVLRKNICPSTGFDLRMSARDMLKLSQCYSLNEKIREIHCDLAPLIHSYSSEPLVKTNLERKIYPSWVFYGNFIHQMGFWGQNGHGRSTSCAIRFNPTLDVFIVATAEHPSAACSAIQKIFVGDKPTIKVSDTGWHKLDSANDEQLETSILGKYVNSRYLLFIEKDLGLRLSIFSRGNAPINLVSAQLQKITPDLYTAPPGSNNIASYLQFLNIDNTIYIYTNNFVFKKDL